MASSDWKVIALLLFYEFIHFEIVRVILHAVGVVFGGKVPNGRIFSVGASAWGLFWKFNLLYFFFPKYVVFSFCLLLDFCSRSFFLPFFLYL